MRIWALPTTVLLLALVGAGVATGGMDLLALESEIKFMVTGGVLLFAVSVDALARPRSESS